MATTPLPLEHSVVWGGYGYGNTGDDLCLALALRDLRLAQDGTLEVLSPVPEHTRLTNPDARVTLHREYRASRRQLQRCFWGLTTWAETSGNRGLTRQLYDLALRHPQRIGGETDWLQSMSRASRLHLAGGGYLAEQFNWRHFIRPVRLARHLGIPVTTSPLGLGPFPTASQAAALARALSGTRLVVRDEDSARLCQAHGVVAIEKPDDGFRCTEVLDLPAHAPLPPDHPAVGVCIFNQYSRAWTPKTGDWWVALLQSMARAWPHVRLEGFCFHTNRQMDYDTTRALFVRAGLRAEAVRPPDPDFRKSITDLRGYRAIVSTRFHAVVAGSVLGIPSVAVAMDAYYLAKMRAALKHAPAPVSILNPRVDPPETALAGLAPQPRGP